MQDLRVYYLRFVFHFFFFFHESSFKQFVGVHILRFAKRLSNAFDELFVFVPLLPAPIHVDPFGIVFIPYNMSQFYVLNHQSHNQLNKKKQISAPFENKKTYHILASAAICNCQYSLSV